MNTETLPSHVDQRLRGSMQGLVHTAKRSIPLLDFLVEGARLENRRARAKRTSRAKSLFWCPGFYFEEIGLNRIVK
jgi:hypothetical protein